MMRRLLALAAAAVVAAALAAPVAAAQPVVVTDEVVVDDTIDCGGGLTYDLHLEGRFVVIDYGDALKIIGNIEGTATASNGVVVQIRHGWTETFDWVEGTWTATGLGFGEGVIGTRVRSLDRGLIVIDLGFGDLIFEAGSHEFAFSGLDPDSYTCALILEAAA